MDRKSSNDEREPHDQRNLTDSSHSVYCLTSRIHSYPCGIASCCGVKEQPLGLRELALGGYKPSDTYKIAYAE